MRQRVAGIGGVAVGPVEGAAGIEAEASTRFSPGNAAGWAFYLFVLAVAAIVLIAYSSSR